MNRIRRIVAATCAALAPVIAAAAPGDHVWSKGWNVQGVGAAVDGSGAAACTGTFSGAVDFGGGTLTATGSDIFVAKYSAGGAHLWSHVYESTSFPTVTAIACAPAGDVYVAGVLTKGGTLDFGGGPIGLPDGTLWAVRFDPDGNHVWSDTFGFGVVNDIDASDSEVVFTGRNTSSADFGGGPLGATGNTQAIVAKLAPDKSHVWSLAFGDAATQEGREVGLLGSGDVVVLASLRGTIDFGGGGITETDGSDDFALARLGATGTHVWSRQLTGAFSAFRSGMDVTSSGAIVATGAFTGTANLGGSTLTSSGTDVWVGRYDSSGNHLWSARFGSTGTDAGNGAWFDPDGHAVISGVYSLTPDFGGGVLPNAGSQDVFVLTLDTDGSHLWSRGFGTTGFESRCEVEVGPTGDPVVNMTAGTGIDVGGGALTGTFVLARLGGAGEGPVVATPPVAVPGSDRLRAFPNPFLDGTVIRAASGTPGAEAAVEVLDANGRRVRRLVPAAGETAWDGRDEHGDRVAAGVYFVRAASAGQVETTKVTRIR